MKIPVCIKPEYVIYLEWFDNHIWIHTDVFNWNKKVKKNFLKDVETVQSLLPLPLVALVKEEDYKLYKFANLVGFKPTMKINLNDGSKATIFSWSK